MSNSPNPDLPHRISLGRPDETAARRISIWAFGGIGVLMLSLIVPLWVAPDPSTGDEMIAGLSCLLFGFGALFCAMALVLWVQRPDEVIIDFDKGVLHTDDQTYPCSAIDQVVVSLEREHQGRFQFARWYARAYIAGVTGPVVIARRRDITDIYTTLRRLHSTYGHRFRVEDATSIPDPNATSRPSSPPESVTWTYLNGFTWLFGLAGILIPILTLRPDEGLDQITIFGIFFASLLGIVALVSLYHYAREWSLPLGQGRYQLRRKGTQIECSAPGSSTQWQIDDVDYIMRRSEMLHGVVILGNGVAEILPCTLMNLDEIYSDIVAMHTPPQDW